MAIQNTLQQFYKNIFYVGERIKPHRTDISFPMSISFCVLIWCCMKHWTSFNDISWLTFWNTNTIYVFLLTQDWKKLIPIYCLFLTFTFFKKEEFNDISDIVLKFSSHRGQHWGLLFMMSLRWHYLPPPKLTKYL